jgi:hypothetical protein
MNLNKIFIRNLIFLQKLDLQCTGQKTSAWYHYGRIALKNRHGNHVQGGIIFPNLD